MIDKELPSDDNADTNKPEQPKISMDTVSQTKGDIENVLHASFQLDKKLMEEYPEMEAVNKAIENYPSQDIWNISQIYLNSKAVDRFIQEVLDNQPTSDIEYHLQVVENWLQKLRTAERPEYANFLTKESEKLTDRKQRAKWAIGVRKRIKWIYRYVVWGWNIL